MSATMAPLPAGGRSHLSGPKSLNQFASQFSAANYPRVAAMKPWPCQRCWKRCVRDRHSECRPPRPRQLACSADYNTSDEDQKDRHRQVGLLLEFLEAVVDPRRASEKHRAYEEEYRDGSGGEGHNLENH